jgi:thiosulfate dehydrogenase
VGFVKQQTLAASILALVLTAGSDHCAALADEFTEEELKRSKSECMSVVKEGRQIWFSAELGNNGFDCIDYHSGVANIHPETSPKFQQQLGRVVTLREMIN